MGCGALVADRQRTWPTTFDFSRNYLHLDELFQHGAPLEYETEEGDIVRLTEGKSPGRLECFLNSDAKGEVTELSFNTSSGRLTQQGGVPLCGGSDGRGSVVRLKDRDRVIYLLSWLAKQCQVPGLEVPNEEPLAFVLLLLERPVTCPLGSLIIASKLDFDEHTPNCRMAFFGRILSEADPKDMKALRLVKMKSKVGFLDRIDKQDKTLIICRDMFKADTDFALFLGLKVVHEASGTEGILEGLFAQEGKVKVRFPHELPVKADAKGVVKGNEKIVLFFKKYDFEHSKRIIQ